MTPIVKHGKYMTQINTSPIYDDTIVTLKIHGKSVMVYENDQIIGWIVAPVMKVVRGIRKMYPEVNIRLV